MVVAPSVSPGDAKRWGGVQDTDEEEEAAMADLVQVIEQQGPLPIKVSAKIESTGTSIVTVAGSCWLPNPPAAMIGIGLSIDGNLMQKAIIFANQASMHLAVVPVTFAYAFPWTQDQQHVFELDNLTGTTSDLNDFFVVTVEY
jgi:hypothetical protein